MCSELSEPAGGAAAGPARHPVTSSSSCSINEIKSGEAGTAQWEAAEDGDSAAGGIW